MKAEILLVAAENSAENYARQLLSQVKKEGLEWRFWGVGGAGLRQDGMEIFHDSSGLGIVGILEVVSALRKLRKLKNDLVAEAVRRGCRYALLIDYPDFNLKLARDLKKNGVQVFHYIAPTVWAWRYNRVKLLRRYLERLFIIFPFEREIYEREGVPYTLLQHPILSRWRQVQRGGGFLSASGLEPEKKLIAFLPGSRPGEVRRLLPVMRETARMLRRDFSDLQFALLLADSVPPDMIKEFADEYNIRIFTQDCRQELLANSDLVIGSCGTATLEVALSGAPLVVLYKVNMLSYLLGISFVKIRRYSIVNILSGREVAREFIQRECVPNKVYREARKILTDHAYREKMLEGFRELKASLSGEKSAEETIAEVLREAIAKS